MWDIAVATPPSPSLIVRHHHRHRSASSIRCRSAACRHGHGGLWICLFCPLFHFLHSGPSPSLPANTHPRGRNVRWVTDGGRRVTAARRATARRVEDSREYPTGRAKRPSTITIHHHHHYHHPIYCTIWYSSLSREVVGNSRWSTEPGAAHCQLMSNRCIPLMRHGLKLVCCL